MTQPPRSFDLEPFRPKVGDCVIWEDFPATRSTNQDGTLSILSHRAGGRYRIGPEAAATMNRVRYSGNIPNLLTTWLVDQRVQGTNEPEVTEKIIEYVRNRRTLTIMEKADRLLTCLAEEAYELGWGIDFTDRTPNIIRQLGIDPGQIDHARSKHTNLLAYAWSESDDWDAIKALMDYLERREFVALVHGPTPQGTYRYEVTVEGYAKVEDVIGSTVSNQAFVAMWFDSSMNATYEKGIEPAIQAAGFDAKVINRDPTVDKIDDAIIAEIRRSKFIVADFTHGEKGARGGVYFEAGFAMGLGIPVIFACRHDMVDKLHFDTRQYSHVVWNDPDDLRQQLLERIQARIT